MSSSRNPIGLDDLFRAARAEHAPTADQLASLSEGLRGALGSAPEYAEIGRLGKFSRRLGRWGGGGGIAVGVGALVALTSLWAADPAGLRSRALGKGTLNEVVPTQPSPEFELLGLATLSQEGQAEPQVSRRHVTSRLGFKNEQRFSAPAAGGGGGLAQSGTAEGDAVLLRDIEQLSGVQAALRAGQPRRALELLADARIERLKGHAEALRASAECLAGLGDQTAQRLQSAEDDAAARAARQQALRVCGLAK